LIDSKLRIAILSKFYLILIFLHILALALFSTRMVIFGKITTPSITVKLNLLFILFLYLLSSTIKNREKIGFNLAILFHVFFILNNTLIFCKKTPFLSIEGLSSGYYVFEAPVILASIFTNILILLYLILCYPRKTSFFKPQSKRKHKKAPLHL